MDIQEEDVDIKMEIVNTKGQTEDIEDMDIHKDDADILEKDTRFPDLPKKVRSEFFVVIENNYPLLLRKRRHCC